MCFTKVKIKLSENKIFDDSYAAQSLKINVRILFSDFFLWRESFVVLRIPFE